VKPRKYAARPGGWAATLWSSMTHTQEAADALMVTTRVALTRMLEGTAEDKHFMRLGVDVNMAFIRANQIGATPEVVQTLTAAGEALKAAEGIFERHGKYGLTGPGRLDLMAGVDVFESILRASSPRQMHDAEQELSRHLTRLERKKPQETCAP
jgi:hypothetical protein